MNHILRVLVFLALVVLPRVAWGQGNDAIVPTDPTLNQVNWAAAIEGATITGCAPSGSFTQAKLIDSIGSDYLAGYMNCSIPSQSLVLNLGQPRSFHTFQLHLYDGDDRFFRYKVETSSDDIAYSVLIDRTAGSHRGVQLIEVAPTVAKFIRITGTHSSLNTTFHLVDEILLIGNQVTTPEPPLSVVVDGKLNAGTSYTVGQKVNLNAGIYRISVTGGAVSPWGVDSTNNGETWGNRLDVTTALYNRSYIFGYIHNRISYSATPEAAAAAFANQYFTIQLPAQSDVYLWLYDTTTTDNRGSHTIKIEQVSGPNDTLLERVRDAMTRSVLWQQPTVANWYSSSYPNLDWFNPAAASPYCYGCHIQSQAVVGLNESKRKLPSLPVDGEFLSTAATIFLKWQNAAGWISPNHNEYYVTQASLWVWALQSFNQSSFAQSTPGVLNALNWLKTKQQANGGWNPDHSSGEALIMYNDGTPSAAHTTGNILALGRVIAELGGETFVDGPGVTIAGSEVLLSQNFGYVVDVLMQPVLDVTGIRITISDSFASDKNFVLSEFEVFNNDQQQLIIGTEANFSQSNYPISESINGIKNNTGDGWAYFPQNVVQTPAKGLWRFGSAIDLNRIRIYEVNPSNQLKKFSLEVTSDPNPTLTSNFTPVEITGVGSYVSEPGGTVEQFKLMLTNAVNLYLSAGWNFGRNVRTASETVIGLHGATAYVDPSLGSAIIAKLSEINLWLRSAQNADGGWGDQPGAISRGYESAHALRALLLLTPGDLDDAIINGANYLLTTQEGQGSWRPQAPVDTKLAVTTWVEIALPTLFEVLSQAYTQNTIADLMAFGLSNKVELGWSPISAAHGYNIYRRTSELPYIKIATNYQSAVATYEDTNVVNEATYYYKINWLDDQGGESANSNEASATPYGMMCGGDSPPIIISAPPTGGAQGALYQYQVEATDADVGDILTYSLMVAPTGMIIDPVSGAITWTPLNTQGGNHLVRVRVEDSIGRFATQAYQLNVALIFFNYPPLIVSTAGETAAAGVQYVYDCKALDPNATDILTYSIVQAPLGATINPTTGRVRWTPSVDQVGEGFGFKVRVTDLAAAFDEQEFIVSVIANEAPAITSSPSTNAYRLQVYYYDVEASDPEGATLTYQLIAAPTGMSMNSSTGIILWSPTLSQIGDHSVTVKVTDPGNLSATQSYTLTVPPNDPPYFTSTPVLNSAAESAYSYDANASDSDSTMLTFAIVTSPTGMTINASNGIVSWSPAVADQGAHDISLKVSDPEGLSATQSYTLNVGAPGSSGGGGAIPLGGVTVTMNAPEPGATITIPTELFATIVSTTGPPDSWSARLLREGTDFEQSLGSAAGGLTSGSIGKIDPTIIPNDSYIVEISVQQGTSTGYYTFPYDVVSYLKLGEFSLKVADVTIPMTGLPLTIQRAYSTIDRSKFEFGSGWRLDIPGRVVDSASESFGEPFTNNTRVFVTRPDGKRVGFRFTPYKLHPFFPFWIPSFTPDPGVTDALEVDQTVLFNSGGYFWELFGEFNPSKYYLTTRERVRYTIDETAGLLQARDANFNTLTFTNGAITHSSGAAITIERDSANRVTKITDLAGKTVTYGYSPEGDLITVTNQIGETTTYSYQAGHYLKTITLNDGTVVLENFYSPDGRLIKQIDGEGNETLIGINVDAQTEVVTDRRGNITTYKYDTAGNLIKRTEPSGAVWEYGYDSNFNLILEKDPAGKTKSAVYDANSRLLSVTDKLGRTTTYNYNPLFQVTKVTNPLGASANLAYNSNGNLLSISDFTGRTRSFSYDLFGNLTKLIDGKGEEIQVTYDSLGRPVSLLNPLGARVDFVYDSNGNLLSKTQYRTLSGGGVAGSDPISVVTSYEYDEQGRVIKVTDGEGYFAITEWNEWNKPLKFTDKRGIVTTFEYDGNGNLLKINRPDGSFEGYQYSLLAEVDRLGRTITHEYDPLGRLIKSIHPDTTFRTYEYDEVGKLTKEINENGAPTLYGYDANGRQTSITDALGRTIHSSYNEQGYLIASTDALGRVTQYEVDGGGRILKTIHPDGTFESWSYDENGRELTYTDTVGNTSSKLYDDGGRLIKEIDELGHAISHIYDEVGNRIKTVDQAGNTTHYEYDNLGQLLVEQFPLGGVTQYTWDPNGNRLSVKDPNNRLTQYQYDIDDRLIKSIDALGGGTEFGFDAVGNRVSVKDPGGNVTTFSYDTRNRQVEIHDPLGGVISHLYDGVGNITQTISRRGLIKQFSYSPINEVLEEKWIDSGSTVRTKQYSYNAVGSVLSEGDGVSAYAYQYDNLDRLVSVDNFGTPGVPHTVLTKQYDALGNVVSTVDSFGYGIQSVYDPRGKLASREYQSPNSTARFDLSYLSTGDRESISRFEDLLAQLQGGSSELSYDANRRVTGYVHRSDTGTAISTSDYAYNPGNEVVTESHDGEDSQYSYDALGQILSAQYQSYPDESFQYDANGNPIAAGYIIGANNRVLSDPQFDYAYDSDGNLVTKDNRVSEETGYFYYDHDNRLTKYELKSSGGATLVLVQYGYDVRGRRISRSVNGTPSYYLYDEEHVWADFGQADSGGGANRLASYVHADTIDELLAIERSGEGVSYYLTDQLGSVRSRVNASGSNLHQKFYKAFGGINTQSGTAERYGFTGREYDSEVGMYYYRARMFDPRLGRFISEDPLGFEAGDANLYRYVGNSPANGRDPSGMSIAISYGQLLGVTAAVLATQAYTTTRYVASFSPTSPAVLDGVRKSIKQAVQSTFDFAIIAVDSSKNLGFVKEINTIIALVVGAFELGQVQPYPSELTGEEVKPIPLSDTLDVTIIQTKKGPCPPCPSNIVQVDRTHPHWPCPADHWHCLKYHQNPRTCECFLERHDPPKNPLAVSSLGGCLERGAPGPLTCG